MGIGSIECPDCGRGFSWWQRAVGEYRQHLRNCASRQQRMHEAYLSTGCRGCPAGCYDRAEEDKGDKPESE